MITATELELRANLTEIEDLMNVAAAHGDWARLDELEFAYECGRAELAQYVLGHADAFQDDDEPRQPTSRDFTPDQIERGRQLAAAENDLLIAPPGPRSGLVEFFLDSARKWLGEATEAGQRALRLTIVRESFQASFGGRLDPLWLSPAVS